MKIFLYEYLTGGGMFVCSNQPATRSLLLEGGAMLRAVATDLAGIAGVELAIQLDRRTRAHDVPNCQVQRIGNAAEHDRSFQRLAGRADLTIVIAPELDQILLRKCQKVEKLGGRLLGPSSETVALLSDKFATSRRLANGGVRVPEMRLETLSRPALRSLLPAVVKPRFGAGSQDMRLIRTWGELDRVSLGGKVLEAFCPGQPASVAALCGPRCTELLPAVAQQLSQDGRFQYLGGRLPISRSLSPTVAAGSATEQALHDRAQHLVRGALRALPSTCGYLGFDLVLGDAPDGSQDFVIEVNPRLTTSYVGLRVSCRQNLAQAMIDVALGKPVELSYCDKPIEFLPDGSVTIPRFALGKE